MGCYGILVQRLTETWVYIGSGDIRQRLLDHIDDNPCITQEQPDPVGRQYSSGQS